jgi:DNA-binding MarR family transcriptional regulator
VRDSILQSAIEYAIFGFDAIPLAPKSKKPVFENWQNRAPSEMWERAPRDANIGLRCGGDARLCVFDADDDEMPGTSQSIAARLASFGIYAGAYPSIATPSGGRHFYFRLDGDLPGNARRYHADFGRGEFRFNRGAYVCGVPSIVEGKPYRIIAGDLRSLPHIEAGDILPILANAPKTHFTVTGKTGGTERPHIIATPTISRRCWKMLRGEGLERYHSRSEFEYAIIASLINTGHSFDSVLSLFVAHPCGGKFRELSAKNPQDAIKWLFRSFEKARRFCESHESRGRQIANAALEWANARAWCGRTGAIDRAVFLAHCHIAQTSGAIEYGASCRALAELARVGSMTATRATHRLIDAGLIELAKPFTVSLANLYRLGQTDTLPNPLIVWKCISLSTSSHEAFWARKSWAEIYTTLQSESLTVKELAERTGRHIKTIARNLYKMSRIVDGGTGEIIKMVEQDDADKWRAVDVDLDRIAKILGTFGKAERQRERHADERREHRERLQAGKQRPPQAEVTVK